MKRALLWLGVIVGIGIGLAVATGVRQRQRLGAMSDDEIREFLAGKLEGRVPDEQLVQIQNSVIAKVRGSRAVEQP